MSPCLFVFAFVLMPPQDASSSTGGVLSMFKNRIAGIKEQDVKVKPPKSEYSKVDNATTWSTGEVRFRSGSSFVYWAGFACRGTVLVYPDAITIHFGVRRSVEPRDTRSDADLAQWSNSKEVTLRWGDSDPVELAAEYQRFADTDTTMRILIGRSFVERLSVTMRTTDFLKMSAASEVHLRLGPHVDTLKGGAVKPMSRLADAIKALQ